MAVIQKLTNKYFKH